MTIVARLLSGLIRLYQLAVSPYLPMSCRYQPTCSAYAREALMRRGPLVGSWLALRRVARCHPWGGAGFDPVHGPSAERTDGRRPLSAGPRP